MKLLIVLMMFPQFVETIYSPALPSIATAFEVSENKAQWTISIYFIAFALGVVFWGIQSDYIGRRKAMIYGLLTYCIASLLPLFYSTFEVILFARGLAAFGIAVGSVITQTIIRDVYTGKELSKVFSIMGVALSISPIIGLLVGGTVVKSYNHYGIFTLLAILSFILATITIFTLPETLQNNIPLKRQQIKELAQQLYTDTSIWLFALLIMGFNVMLFSYYSFAPFIFKHTELDPSIYGYSGIVLSIGTFVGSTINKYCIKKNYSPYLLIWSASLLSLSSASFVYFTQHTLYFLLPTLFSVAAFGIAIPNILSQSLIKYKQQIGTAGALFGLLYYLLIGLGLLFSSELPNMGIVYLCFGTLVALLSFILYTKKRAIN
ncbi:MAG: multidrug effflux MFS transporter [Flavobacteriaceae bacterium]|nr:multidrug effflux MFS transporter [Flavobacteriaceae bacterium]